MPDATLDALAKLPDPRVVLAVSGGRDSMVLLEAAALAIPDRIAAVATFDHATGEHAERAVRLVRRRARALRLRVESARALPALRATEAGWRRARWAFLRAAAREHDAAVVTAHTRDDLLETVVMRLLRGTGARGLAAMLVEPPAAPVVVRRPLLGMARADVARWAARRDVRWLDDPSNSSRRWLRNRVRLDLLPAMERARPGIGDALLALAHEAADVRAALDACAAALATPGPGGSLMIAARGLAGYDAEALAALWPAIAARAGLALDRRGTLRAAAFTRGAKSGGTVQLSGGFELLRRRDGTTDGFVLRGASDPRRARAVLSHRAAAQPAGVVVLGRSTRFGAWRFRRSELGGTAAARDDAWRVELPAGVALHVRAWRPGDRMRDDRSGAPRRVRRFFGDARIPGMDRAGWPVVLAAGEIVWIPGVRRSDAATDRSGRPGVRYVCERISD